MNKAIFLFTMKRYLHWVNLLVGGLNVLFFSFFCGMLLLVDDTVSKEMARACLFGPTLVIIVSYAVISPQVANSQQRKDGEYLSLIFSRPIPRWSYVVTKWLTGSFFVACIMVLQTVLAYGFAFILLRFWGGHVTNIFDAYAVTDAMFNSLGYTAFVVFISSMPRRFAVIAFILYLYGTFITSIVVGTASFLNTLSLDHVSKTVTALGQLFFSVLVVGVDSYHIVNSSTFPMANFLTYFSNIALYLTLSTLIMSYREFFYAND